MGLHWSCRRRALTQNTWRITNAYVEEIFLFTTELDLLTPEFFFELFISQRYIKTWEGIRKK